MLIVLYESTGDSKVTLYMTPQTGAARMKIRLHVIRFIMNQTKMDF